MPETKKLPQQSQKAQKSQEKKEGEKLAQVKLETQKTQKQDYWTIIVITPEGKKIFIQLPAERFDEGLMISLRGMTIKIPEQRLEGYQKELKKTQQKVQAIGEKLQAQVNLPFLIVEELGKNLLETIRNAALNSPLREADKEKIKKLLGEINKELPRQIYELEFTEEEKENLRRLIYFITRNIKIYINDPSSNLEEFLKLEDMKEIKNQILEKVKEKKYDEIIKILISRITNWLSKNKIYFNKEKFNSIIHPLICAIVGYTVQVVEESQVEISPSLKPEDQEKLKNLKEQLKQQRKKRQ